MSQVQYTCVYAAVVWLIQRLSRKSQSARKRWTLSLSKRHRRVTRVNACVGRSQHVWWGRTRRPSYFPWGTAAAPKNKQTGMSRMMNPHTLVSQRGDRSLTRIRGEMVTRAWVCLNEARFRVRAGNVWKGCYWIHGAGLLPDDRGLPLHDGKYDVITSPNNISYIAIL